MQSLLDLQTRMNVEYEKAVRFFGEDSAKTRSDEFFAVFYQFLGTFEVMVSCGGEFKMRCN